MRYLAHSAPWLGLALWGAKCKHVMQKQGRRQSISMSSACMAIWPALAEVARAGAGSSQWLPAVRAGRREGGGHRRGGGHRDRRQRLLFQRINEGHQAVGGDQLQAHEPVGGAVAAHKVGQDDRGRQTDDLQVLRGWVEGGREGSVSSSRVGEGGTIGPKKTDKSGWPEGSVSVSNPTATAAAATTSCSPSDSR